MFIQNGFYKGMLGFKNLKISEKHAIIIGYLSLIISLIAIKISYNSSQDTKKYKDDLKLISHRKNAPYFEAINLRIDATSKGYYGSKHKYDYSNKRKENNDKLMGLDSLITKIPNDYPDNRYIGIRLINKGEELRKFKITPNNISLFRDNVTNDTFILKYLYNKNNYGQILKFNITYETINGNLETQTWETKIGHKHIKRIVPNSL